MQRLHSTRRATAFLFALATVVVSSSCVTNPATGNRQLNLLSRDQEIALGEQAMTQLTQQYDGAVADPALAAYVQRVGERVAATVESEYDDLPWEFTLLDSEAINAFALPGGKVFITLGLASRMTNEAQLAATLGHEIGHVTAEHADKRISNNLIVSTVLSGAATAAGGSQEALIRNAIPRIVDAAGKGFLLKFSRDEELEADSLGMRYMTSAGYDPRGMLQLMQVLEEEAASSSRNLEFFSTHPHPARRIDQIKTKLNKKRYQRAMVDGEHDFKEAQFRRDFLARLQR